jgi:beta-lactamase regulating signal transducer with metallopeptidase domain
MTPHFEWFFHLSPALAATWLDVTLKGTIVLAAAGALCLGWRRASASARHLAWFLAVVSLLILPVFSSWLPSWQRPLWTVSGDLNAGNEFAISLRLAPANKSAASPAAESTAPSVPNTPLATAPSPATVAKLPFSQGWLGLLIGIWVAGALTLAGRLTLSRRQRWNLRQSASIVNDPAWTELLNRLRQELGIRRRVTLLRSEASLMPATWGTGRPVVMLPREADAWPAERRRVVLWHELAHVKRRDCLTQTLTQIICALHWLNPLVWVAARQMRLERERACDDLVLAGGVRPSAYSEHLLEIARSFQALPTGAAIAMARSSQVGGRVRAIIDARRNHRGLTPVAALGMAILMLGFAAAVAANKANGAALDKNDPQRFPAPLKPFFATKEKQARAIAKQLDLEIAPEIWEYYRAAAQADWRRVNTLYQTVLRKRAGQYAGSTSDPTVANPVFQTIIETGCAYEAFSEGNQIFLEPLAKDIVASIPRGSLYFGGTDPGRALITAYSKSHETGDPFFVLTQNALADGNYLRYLRSFYDTRLHLPSEADSARCCQNYLREAQIRARHDTQFPDEPKQLKPGENVTENAGRVSIGGQESVMAINGLLVQSIIEQNPGRDVYLEESLPIDWMYSHLQPHGLIMKLNSEPLAEMTAAIAQRDHAFWAKRLQPLLGAWFKANPSLAQVATYVEDVYLDHDAKDYHSDPQFIADDYTRKTYAKLRTAIAGVYAWRAEHATQEAEKARAIQEADFAFRQAWATCPYSPETGLRYVNFLMRQNRQADARLLVATALQAQAANGSADPAFKAIANQLKATSK